eukprot:5661805-Prymnesium_polylepis.1
MAIWAIATTRRSTATQLFTNAVPNTSARVLLDGRTKTIAIAVQKMVSVALCTHASSSLNPLATAAFVSAGEATMVGIAMPPKMVQ